MRLLRILLVVVATGACTSALAQTNALENRSMSLEDCIAIALQHNLDVKIKRLNPEINRFTLNASYGAYDPSLSASGEHDYSRLPGGVDPQGRPYSGTASESDRFSTSIQGLLPWGTTYNFGGSMADTYGTSPGFASISTFSGFTTNVVFDNSNVPSGYYLTTNFQSVPVQVRRPFENTGGSVGFFQLRQPLLKNFWIDSTRLQIYIDKKNLKISELDLRFQVMNTVRLVDQAYHNLIFAQENIKVQQSALELNQRQLAENKKRVEVGTMAPLDEKQAQSRVAASKADLFAALGTEETDQRVLKSLLSDDYSKWEKVAIQPTEKLVAVPQAFNLAESWRKGLSQRPDLIEQKLSLDKQDYTIRFQRNQLFPELDLFGTAGYNASAKEFSGAFDQIGGRDNPFWSYGAQMTIPLTRTTARNNYRAAKATREQIELQLKQLEQNIMIIIENDLATANTAFQRVDATREARIYAEAALDAERKKLESGKSTSFVVLQLTKDLTTARSEEISALANYNIALTQLIFDEGTILERHEVKLEIK